MPNGEDLDDKVRRVAATKRVLATNLDDETIAGLSPTKIGNLTNVALVRVLEDQTNDLQDRLDAVAAERNQLRNLEPQVAVLSERLKNVLSNDLFASIAIGGGGIVLALSGLAGDKDIGWKWGLIAGGAALQLYGLARQISQTCTVSPNPDEPPRVPPQKPVAPEDLV